MHLLDLKLDEDMRSGMHLLELKLDEEMRSWSVIEKERKDTEYVAVEPINNKSLSETEEKEERMKRIKRLVQEFSGDAPPSSEYIIGDRDVLERWFTELGGGWILELNNDSPPYCLCSELDSGTCSLKSRTPSSRLSFQVVAPAPCPAFARKNMRPSSVGTKIAFRINSSLQNFSRKPMLAMLAFVDVICRKVAINISSRVPATYVMEKLSILLGVRFALSESEALHK